MSLKVANDIDSREHASLAANRPAALRVHSIQERHSHECWAHVDEQGFHMPLRTPQVQSVRSQQDSIPLGSDNEAVRAVRSLVEDQWVQAPPKTPAVKAVRKQVEAGFHKPADTGVVARVRSIQEDYYPGINCLADRGAATRELSVPVSLTLTSPGATALKSPSLPTAFAHRASINTETAQSPVAAAAPLPPAQLEVKQGEPQESGTQTVAAPELMSTLDPQVLQHAALVAAVRQHEEDMWVQQPQDSQRIQTVRDGEEACFKAPANSPQVQGVRKRISAFATVTTNPAIHHIRHAEESFRSAESSSAASRAISLQCEDPFAGYDSRATSRPASRTVSRNVSLSAHNPGPSASITHAHT